MYDIMKISTASISELSYSFHPWSDTQKDFGSGTAWIVTPNRSILVNLNVDGVATGHSALIERFKLLEDLVSGKEWLIIPNVIGHSLQEILTVNS